MNPSICVSTPSRLCLFGEHQDFLGLSVIAVAINLRFYARVTPGAGDVIHIKIRDERLDTLNVQNDKGLYQECDVRFDTEITYRNEKDYFRSTVNTLKKQGYPLRGLEIRMDSEIPIGKGMCSSSTMIVVLIRAILEGIGHPDANDALRIADLAYQAEVEEFGQPGGRMDQLTSALGGLVHLTFDGEPQVRRIDQTLQGEFLLFDSMERKDTLRVLASSKTPTLEGLAQIGVGIRDLAEGRADMALVEQLDPYRRARVLANVENYRLLQEGLALLSAETVDDARLGALLSAHHAQLRDGLGISTPVIESILDRAIAAGAYGGKINGSGGGGCCFVYARSEDCEKILRAVPYPGKRLAQDTGVRRDA